MNRLLYAAVGGVIFMAPWHLRLLVPTSASYQFGMLHEAGSLAVYASDIFLAAALIMWGIHVIRGRMDIALPERWLLIPWVALLVLFILSAAWSSVPVIAVYRAMRWLMVGVFALMIYNRVVPVRFIARCLHAGVLFQAGLALMQFGVQSSLGLTLLGEPVLAPGAPGVADEVLGASSALRAYGTTAHPNVLAAWLIAGLIFSFSLGRFAWLARIVYMGALIATFSRAGWLAGLVCLVVLCVLERKTLMQRLRARSWVSWAGMSGAFIAALVAVWPVLMARFGPGTFGARFSLFDRFGELVASPFRFLLGQGAGQSALVPGGALAPWDHQPLHNVFLLTWSELGLLGAIALSVLFSLGALHVWRSYKQQKHPLSLQVLLLLLALFVLSLFDHYLFDVQAGQLLAGLTLGFLGCVAMSRFKPVRRTRPSGC